MLRMVIPFSVKIKDEKVRGWIRGNEDGNFAAYDWAGGRLRTIYLLDIDWWSGGASQPATLLFGEREFRLRVRAGTIEVITLSDAVAVMPAGADVDILDIRQARGAVVIVLQSDGPTDLRVFFRNGSAAPRTIHARGSGVREIAIP